MASDEERDLFPGMTANNEKLRGFFLLITNTEYRARLLTHSPGLETAYDWLHEIISRAALGTGEVDHATITIEHPHIFAAVLTVAHAVAFDSEKRRLPPLEIAESVVLTDHLSHQ